ncbi:Uncharacterised protein [Klebsiella pneumoniae]|nr:Uncharacterised protein [Klebsiella pneumoniae]
MFINGFYRAVVFQMDCDTACQMIQSGGNSIVGSYFLGFVQALVLSHPFACCFRRQNQRLAVVNIDQPLIGRSGHYQKPFGFVAALKRNAADRSHEYWLAISKMNEIGLLLVAFFFPFEPFISKADRPAMLPQRFKHSAAGCRLNPGINQRWLIPPPWCVTPVDRIEVQLFVAFAQEQNFSPWHHVVPADWFWIIGDIPLSFFGKISQVFFTCL